jgi:hypothetical protein
VTLAALVAIGLGQLTAARPALAEPSPRSWPAPLNECLKSLDRELVGHARDTVATAPLASAPQAAAAKGTGYPGCGGAPVDDDRPRCAATCGNLCRQDLPVTAGAPAEVVLTGQISGQGRVWLVRRTDGPSSSFRVVAEQTVAADEVVPISTLEAERLAKVYGSVWRAPVHPPRLASGERYVFGVLAWHYVDDRWTGELHAVIARPTGTLRLHRVYRVAGEQD